MSPHTNVFDSVTTFLPVPIWKYADWNNSKAAYLHNLCLTAQNCRFQSLQTPKHQLHQWANTKGQRCRNLGKQSGIQWLNPQQLTITKGAVVYAKRFWIPVAYTNRFWIFSRYVYYENRDR